MIAWTGQVLAPVEGAGFSVQGNDIYIYIYIYIKGNDTRSGVGHAPRHAPRAVSNEINGKPHTSSSKLEVARVSAAHWRALKTFRGAPGSSKLDTGRGPCAAREYPRVWGGANPVVYKTVRTIRQSGQ